MKAAIGCASSRSLVEEGHHARELARRTGLQVQENQARRLLNDITAYRSWLERAGGRPVPEAVGRLRWLRRGLRAARSPRSRPT